MKPNKNIAVLTIHQVKAIIFDKDGTILDFYNTWRPIWDKILQDVTNKFQVDQKAIEAICKALGITDTGFTSDSVFVKDDYATITKAIFDVDGIDKETKEDIFHHVGDFVEKEGHHHTNAHVIDGVEDTLKVLKKQGFILGLITSDMKKLADKHLEEAGLTAYFDYIGSDDGLMKVKPHPDLLEDFCRKFDLEPKEIAMVGDSIIDMEFAKKNNMGYAIYVRSGYPDKQAEKMADMILEDVSQLIMSK